MQATITNIEKATLQEDNSQFLDVTFEISGSYPATNEADEPIEIEVSETRKLGFPLDTPEETILEEVKNYVVGYEGDLLLAEKNKKHEAAEKQADETINNLTGKTVASSDEVEPVENKE